MEGNVPVQIKTIFTRGKVTVLCSSMLVLFLYFVLVLKDDRYPSTGQEGETDPIRPSAEMATGPSVVRKQCEEEDLLKCDCVMPLKVESWVSLVKTCGEAKAAQLLTRAIEGGYEPDEQFIEGFHRPMVLRYSTVPSPPDRGQNPSIYLTEYNIQQADSGKCWYFSDVQGFKCLPTLLIIGFQRAATREIFEWLSIHPSMKGYGSKFSRIRGGSVVSVETHYFDSLPESQPFHELQPVRRKKLLGPLTETWSSVYLKDSPVFTLTEVLQSRVVFEKTPAYADQTNPNTIRRLLPSARLAVSLREPASRLWSSYWRRCHALSRKDCSVDDFDKAILQPAEACGLSGIVLTEENYKIKETECMNGFVTGFDLRAVLVGYYEIYIRRFDDAFVNTEARMYVTFSEVFASDPFRVMDELQTFAKVPQFDYKPKARLDALSKMYYVSEKSKALKARPVGYVSLGAIPSEVRGRIYALYAQANKSLKKYLDRGGRFITKTSTIPDWYSKIYD